jgi:hypothetical protein
VTDAYIIAVAFSLAPLYALRPSVVSASDDGSPHLLLSGSNDAQAFRASVSAKVSGDYVLPWIGCRRTQSKSVASDRSRRWVNMRRICWGRTRSNDRSAGIFAS